MFKALGRRLPGLIRDVLALQEQRPLLPITGKFSAAKQRGLAVEIMKAVGFPFDRGRLDASESRRTDIGDSAITSRATSRARSCGGCPRVHCRIALESRQRAIELVDRGERRRRRQPQSRPELA